MSTHEGYGLDEFLIAASGAGRMGFAATESALMNLARCSMCPFWAACDGSSCQLLIPIQEATLNMEQPEQECSTH